MAALRDHGANDSYSKAITQELHQCARTIVECEVADLSLQNQLSAPCWQHPESHSHLADPVNSSRPWPAMSHEHNMNDAVHQAQSSLGTL